MNITETQTTTINHVGILFRWTPTERKMYGMRSSTASRSSATPRERALPLLPGSLKETMIDCPRLPPISCSSA
jgi:hypothetical protein